MLHLLDHPRYFLLTITRAAQILKAGIAVFFFNTVGAASFCARCPSTWLCRRSTSSWPRSGTTFGRFPPTSWCANYSSPAVRIHLHRGVSNYACRVRCMRGHGAACAAGTVSCMCCLCGARTWYVLYARGTSVVCAICARQGCGMCCLRAVRRNYVLHARGKTGMLCTRGASIRRQGR